MHTIVWSSPAALRQRGIELAHEDILFAKFIGRHIFPGGQLAPPEVIVKHAEDAGFRVERTQSLQPHYARTLDIWSANLAARRDDAVRVASQDLYDTYQHYLTGCARYFKSGHIDVMQFTLAPK